MTHRVHIYPHNDLLNLAHYHLGVIDEKVSSGVDDALALDSMSCLIALAFSVEALINFIGAKLVPGWKERGPFHKKLAQVCHTVGIDFDKGKEPFATIEQLKHLRDQIAHGKPIDTKVVATSSEGLKKAMMAPWEKFLTPTYAEHAFSQIKAFEHELLDKSGIPIGATLTSAFGRSV